MTDSGSVRVPERATPLRSGPIERALAATGALIALSVLVTAAMLAPDPQGHSTHHQLGLPPCAWAVWFDKPCPTCGMTTSFSHAAQGSWLSSITTQPFGALLVVLTCVFFWGATHQALTGSRIGSVAQRAFRPPVFVSLLALAAIAWGYKVATWT